MKQCCEEPFYVFNNVGKQECFYCGNVMKLNGISPDHVVYDQPQPLSEYWCHIEMKTIDGEVKHENYEGISLEDFEIIYGGITDLITAVELKVMNDQQDLK